MRTICISGGTSGIGAGLVVAFLAAGERVYTFGRDPRKINNLSTQWHSAIQTGQLIVLTGDVTDHEFRAHLIDQITKKTMALDVLINNAGVVLTEGDLAEDLVAWRKTLEINLIAPFALTQACLKLFEKSPAPVVINISSVCAQHPFTSCTSMSYAVSKSGLDMLTKRLALSLAGRGIRVNGVAPGVVATKIWADENLMTEIMQQRNLLQNQGIMQIITPDDIAAAVLFLASSAARAITGTILNVDAGYALS